MEPTTPFRNAMTMTCPLCHVALLPTTRQAIEIDYCPQCRGVWLDRGELDKILEREASFLSRGRDRDDRNPGSPDRGYRRDDDDDRDRDRDDYRDGYGRKKKRRGGFLSELLDFD